MFEGFSGWLAEINKRPFVSSSACTRLTTLNCGARGAVSGGEPWSENGRLFISHRYETIVFASTSQAMLQLLIAVFLVLPYASCCVDTTNKWWLIDWHTSPNRHKRHNKSVVGLNQKRGCWVCSGVVVVRVLLDLSDTHGFVCSPSYLRLKAVHKRWMCNVGLVQRSHDYIWRFICCFVLSILTMFIRHES